jgi:DNA-binding MarR family transcriptional regulator
MMTEASSRYEDFFNSQNELHALFTRTLEGILSAEGITVPQTFTLKALKEQGGLCRMSDLAATRFHTPAAMTGIVDRLIHLGLVERSADATDRRVILLSLTEHGTAILARMEKKVQGMMRRFFDSMPEKDRETTVKTFCKLKDFFKEEINAQKKS